MTPRRLIEPARLAGAAVLRTQSDDRLVDLVRDGNDRAFEAIVQRYRGPLLRYCRRYLSPGRAEDAAQQTFVNALAALREGDAEINLRPWLYRIAHNASLNVLRQAGADHEQISEQIDGVETPAQALERGERLRMVVAAVRELPDRQRDALVLQALEGRSYDEIARELGVTGGAVRQLLNRARTTLRQGVTAFTPPALLARLGGAIEAPAAERVAQVVAGAGGGAMLAKAAAVVVVAGAVVGGATDGILEHGSRRDVPAAAAPEAKVASTAGSRPSTRAHLRPVALRKPRRHQSGSSSRHGTRRAHEPLVIATPRAQHHGERTRDDRGGARHGDGDRHSGGGDDSTSLSDDHSGSGSSGSDDGSSSPSGSDDAPLLSTNPDSSGSGSGDSGSGSSGSGGEDPTLTSDSGDGTSGGGTSGGSN